ncbi:CPBP family intramembrane glutamic endopeptidase [Modestobacter altitudinis]|uniref:CPBP family intramembrane glutamic endopeptidase n=1 Tax=Modestobacter altitudinis TaxID=2213158 RepID=UPI00110D22DA|nr:type II CAAX endopeptidase family protein [Modestobacter altitudinis]
MTTTENRRSAASQPVQIRQYTVAGVLGTWAAAALPMAALWWAIGPLLARALDGSTALTRALILVSTAGLAWQFLLVLILVQREQGSLRWAVVKDALWLHAPRSPRTGRRGRWAWLVVIPLVIGFGIEEELPTLPKPEGRNLGVFLGSDAGQSFLSGNWGWFAILAAMVVFNTVLGEELLFRGLLLPRMQGAFGRWDWAANGTLFAVYHLHMPWAIPWTLLDAFLLSYPSKRYNSALIGIAVHSAQSVVILGLALALVLS